MTTAAPPRPAAPRSSPTPSRRTPILMGSYLGYVGYFVGAGLISGGIVHQPLDPARYTQIAAAGVAVFLAATVLNEIFLAERRPTPAKAARVVGASLVLSLGIGMLSGGIQHFSDFPQRAATLIPIGLVLSFLAYAIRQSSKPFDMMLGWRGAVIGLAAICTFLVLQPLANAMAAEGSDEHGHGAAASTSQDQEIVAPQIAPELSDGHDEHGH